MKSTNPYLNFNGRAREAMAFYQSVFGGEISVMTVGETPMADQFPPDKKDTVMHISLTAPGLVIMGSDWGPTEPIHGTDTATNVNCESLDEITRIFNGLSEGGTVSCPLGKQFWGDTFASLTDKFGFNWLMLLPQ